MLRVTVLIAVCVSGIGREALAQDWTIGAYLGAAHTLRSDVHVTLSNPDADVIFADVAYDSRSFSSPIYYGYRIARRLPQHRRVWIEAEVIHVKVYADGESAQPGRGSVAGHAVDAVRMPDLVQRFSMSHGLNFVLANLVFRQVAGRTTLIGRIGGGPVVPHVESVVNHRTRDGYQLAGAGLQGAGGAEVRVWRRIAATIEYKLTRAAPAVDVAAGQVSLRALSHHLAFGVSGRF